MAFRNFSCISGHSKRGKVSFTLEALTRQLLRVLCLAFLRFEFETGEFIEVGAEIRIALREPTTYRLCSAGDANSIANGSSGPITTRTFRHQRWDSEHFHRMRHIEFDEKRDWLNILYTNIIPAFKFERTPRINKSQSATLLFVFGIEPWPINGLPGRGVLSFHRAVGADPNFIVLAAAADLTQSVDVFGGKRPARGHDRFGCRSCGGS